MKWDAIKLRQFLDAFDIRHKEIAKGTGLSEQLLRNLTTGNSKFDRYHDILTAYLEAKKAAKRKEHESMIRFYENFN